MRQLIAASRAPGSQLAGVVQRHQLACNRHTLGPSFFNEVFGGNGVAHPPSCAQLLFDRGYAFRVLTIESVSTGVLNSQAANFVELHRGHAHFLETGLRIR